MDNNLFSILGKFSKLRVLVIGEAILDSSVRGTAGRLSLEAPVPVVSASEEIDLPGGAANVCASAARLGANVEFLSVIGKDAEGDLLLRLLKKEGVNVRQVVRDAERCTLLKRRVYAGEQMLVRYDQGSTEPVSADAERLLLKGIREQCAELDVIILSDYGQGILTQGLLRGIARLQKKGTFLLVADTRRLDAYRGLRLAALRPSYNSAIELLEPGANGHHDPYERLSEAGEKILQALDTQMVAITLDNSGALVLDRDMPVYRTYAPSMPFNLVSGAGDAFITALALGLAAGARSPAAAEIASAFASLVVRNEGMPACCMDELRASLSGDHKLFEEWPALGARLDALRQQGKRIVFTNGVFDILHSAHVAYLNEAKSLGDVLVIGVNSDESVKRLKGPTRPINPLLERCRVLAGLSCVDFVVPFSEDNPVNLVRVVKPDIYVKGGDYTRETLPEASVVEEYGGRLHLVPYIANHSTTGMIERIRKLHSANGERAKAS